MNEQNAGSEGTTTASKERGSSGIAAKSHEAAEQLKNAVVDKTNQARQEADTARDHMAERFRRVASHLRGVGDNLRTDDQMASTLAERASRGVEGIADYIASTDLQGVVRDAERLARRQPAVFFGGAFIVGLALGRFFKNSPSGQARSDWSSSSDAPEQRETPGQQPRRARAQVPGQASQERFRENYDATFARDIPSSPLEGSAEMGGVKRSTSPGNGENSPESNGGRRSGGGRAS
jgi:hypothetical protein